MEKQFFRGGTTLKDQKGAILALTAFLVIILCILFAGMVDFGRTMIVREKTQTAGDAAALASATSEVKKIVNITVHTTDRYYEDLCYGTPCGKRDDPYNVDKTVTGTEEYLIAEGHWKDYSVPDTWSYDYDYTLNNRWVEYGNKNGTDDTAAEFYNANVPSEAQESEIKKIVVYGKPGHPAYPSVIVYAETKIKSLFPGILGTNDHTTITCSQGSTYYQKVNSDKFSHPPADWCWKDW